MKIFLLCDKEPPSIINVNWHWLTILTVLDDSWFGLRLILLYSPKLMFCNSSQTFFWKSVPVNSTGTVNFSVLFLWNIGFNSFSKVLNFVIWCFDDAITFAKFLPCAFSKFRILKNREKKKHFDCQKPPFYLEEFRRIWCTVFHLIF